ncbi:MAG: hypothetical protein ACTSP4_03140, partial [Candidatus Hodarchaeales archaeon]
MGKKTKKRGSSRKKKKASSNKRKKQSKDVSSIKKRDFTEINLALIATSLINWFTENARTFFWRKNKLTSFQYLVVELMLQKTRAETVEIYTKKFIEKYPDPTSILQADIKDLERSLEPLGLSKRRSNHLVKISKSIMENHSGEVPMDRESLLSFTGVGPYIANALLCFGGGVRVTVIDSNVVRIMSRLFTLPKPSDVRRPGIIASVLEEMLPEERFREFNFALLDLGSLVCLPRKP